ncbi:MAG TPA: diguanylate cyclase [Edaphobacter sp.]|jgi:diguanylate cyclase (GGDEF)-like protein|nr:diguanylate cyclase [Edaphobacter sp.]
MSFDVRSGRLQQATARGSSSSWRIRIFGFPWKNTALVVLIYFAVTWIGVAFGAYVAHSNVIWPANGVLLGILLFSRKQHWWPYLAGTALVSAILHVNMGFPVGRSMVYALANVAEVYSAAVLIGKGEDRRPDLVQPKVLGRFVLAVLVGPMFSAAVVKIGSLVVQYGIKYDGIRSWYLADVLGLAIVTPIVLAIRRNKLRLLLRERPTEAMTIWVATAIVSVFISRQNNYPIFFLFFPLVLLAIFRLGLTGSAISMVLLAVPADYFTVQFRGPFSLKTGGHVITSIQLLQFYLMTLIATAYAVGSALAKNERLRESLAESHQRMEMLAGTDALTELPNRRTFDKRISDEWHRAIREKTPLSLLMVDIDHFKAYNDRFGHPAGDVLLREVARAMTTISHRAMDLICRYGGEEFAIILPNTDQDGATLFAERLRLEIANMRRKDQDGALPPITVSVGVSTVRPRTLAVFPQFLETADQALYAAKMAGRNKVQVRPMTDHAIESAISS